MYSKVLVLLVAAAACMQAASARPVRRTLNFNMFMLKPDQSADRLLLSNDGVSRFGPLLEYLVQRFQGLLSVRVNPDHSAPGQVFPGNNQVLPVPDTSENEVDGMPPDAKIPGLVLRPSRTKPGTYEVEIAVVVDDEQPGEDKNKTPKSG